MLLYINCSWNQTGSWCIGHCTSVWNIT